MTLNLSIQENLVPGQDISEKWSLARDAGFDALELRGGADFSDRLPQLRKAQQEGAVFSSICIESDRFIGAFDPERRREARGIMTGLLRAAGMLGLAGVVTPAAWGMHSNRLPPFTPPRSPEEDRSVLIEELAALGAVAGEAGTLVLLEPLNRYEDHMVNTLERGAELAQEAGDHVKVLADSYHMNIEEASPLDALRELAQSGKLGHVHLSDSNRHQPGAGHIDFRVMLKLLADCGYSGHCAIECRLKGEPLAAISETARFLRG